MELLGDPRGTRGRRAGLDPYLVVHVTHAGDMPGDCLGGVPIRLPPNRPGELDHALLCRHAELLMSSHRYLADAVWSDARAAEVLAAICERVARVPSARSHVLCTLLPPIPLPDGALSMVARLYVASYAVWSDPADDVANADWHRSVTDALTRSPRATTRGKPT
jgi:hypothetical protein